MKMRVIRSVFVVSILATFSLAQALEKDNSGMDKQVATIVTFCEKITSDTQPTAADFFMLFGKENESELELILRQRFSDLNINGNWFSNPEALDYVNKVYDNPNRYPSRFMECLRKVEPELFLNKAKRQIQFPPEITKDFKNFSVTVSGKTIVFQFSKEEGLIENVYLPSGKSVYQLIEKCEPGAAKK